MVNRVVSTIDDDLNLQPEVQAVLNRITAAAVDARTITDVVQVAASGTLALNQITQVDASSGAVTMTLPTGAPKGTVVVLEKADSSVNVVTAFGSIRGAASTLTLALARESIQFVADAAGSWNPGAGHKTLGSLDARYAVLAALARTPDALIAGTVTRDGNGAATSAPVVWPDGSAGTYTALVVSTAFPGAVDSYKITYGSPVTRTYTQPTVTRNASGAATAVPAIAVT